MSNLLDLSAKVDPVSLALFATLSEAVGSLGIPFFVVGATSRDMVFELAHGLPGRRATHDKDFGVRVSSWDEFVKLKKSLLATGFFTETKELQRLLYQGQLLVDLLPFGEIAGAHGEFRWPPDEAVVMSTVGFEDAYHAALEVRVQASPPLHLLVASIPGLAILKLTSWADRPHERSKDATDLAYIIEYYLDAGNHERLYNENIDIVDNINFDYVHAGARLLGRDIASIGQMETLGRIREILATETAVHGQHRLVQSMMSAGSVSDHESANRFDEVLALLWEVSRGIEDR